MELQIEKKHSIKKFRHFALYDHCFRMYQVFFFFHLNIKKIN